MSVTSEQSEEAIKKSDKIQSLYNELVDHVHQENDFYKREYANIRDEVSNLLQENNELNKKLLNQEENSSDILFLKSFEANQTKLDNDCVSNLKQQLTCKDNEKKCAEILWRESQNTIKALEYEISQYRSQLRTSGTEEDVIRKYKSTVLQLEDQLGQANKKIENKTKLISALEQNNAILQSEFNSIQDKFRFLHKHNAELRQKNEDLDAIVKQNNEDIAVQEKIISELEQTLEKTCNLAEYYKTRENNISAEAREARETSEKLILEKTVILEENDHLAKTIGGVLKDASKKVDSELQKLKDQYERKLKALEQQIYDTNEHVKLENKRSRETKEHALGLEQKLKAVIKHNACLQTLFNSHLKTMDQQHKKLEILQLAFAKERESNKLYVQRELEVQALLDNNRCLQQRWKELIQDISCKLQCKIDELNRENKSLKQELLTVLRRSTPVDEVLLTACSR